MRPAPKWWNGRHVRLRGVWGNPWGFKSPLRHQPPLDVGFYEGLYRGTIGRCYYRVKRNIETLHSCIELLAFDAPIA